MRRFRGGGGATGVPAERGGAANITTSAPGGMAAAAEAGKAPAAEAAAAGGKAPEEVGKAAAAAAGGAAAAAGGAAAPAADGKPAEGKPAGEAAAGGEGGAAAGGKPDSPFAATSLYVGDLDPAVGEAQLYEIFQQVGHVVSIRVLRDLITRRSLGYAYVNFSTTADAKQAIDMLNYTPVAGKPIRIMFSQRDPSSRKSGVGNIFVKNIDKQVDNRELHELFRDYGMVLSSKVARDVTGQSKGYGFVQFETDEEAKKAIDGVNGKEIRGKPVFVGPFVRRQERSTPGSAFCNVYVKNIPEEMSEEELKNLFEEHGPTTSVVVMKDDEGKSRGFGFVNFEEAEAAAAAVEKLNGTLQGDKEITVCRAEKKSEREAKLRAQFDAERKERAEKFAGANLYLKNLDDTVGDDKLREIFAEYGTITSCRVMKDPNGASRGSGFVAFSSPEEATRAVTEMNGKMVGQKPLYVAIAQRKEDRQQRLKTHFQAQGPRMPPGMQPGMPLYPGAPGMQPGGQMFFPPQMAPPLQPGMPMYAPGMAPGMRPGAPGMPQYFVPMQQGRPGRGRKPGGAMGMGARGGRGGMRMGPGGLRGHPGPVPQPGMQGPPGEMPSNAPPAPEQGAPGGGPVSTATLAAQLAQATPEQQRMITGEALYPLVENLEPQSAAKVTGMLLEMDNSEVLHLIEDHASLLSKVQEAMEVLRQAGQATEAGAVADGIANLSVS